MKSNGIRNQKFKNKLIKFNSINKRKRAKNKKKRSKNKRKRS